MLDTTRRVATPEGIELTLRLAGPVPRALAWSIDFLLRAALVLLVVHAREPPRQAGWGVVLIVAFFVEWLLPAWFETVWGGQTPGKRLFGLAVLNDDGTPVRWPGALTRNLLRAADFLPFLMASAWSHADQPRLQAPGRPRRGHGGGLPGEKAEAARAIPQAAPHAAAAFALARGAARGARFRRALAPASRASAPRSWPSCRRRWSDARRRARAASAHLGIANYLGGRAMKQMPFEAAHAARMGRVRGVPRQPKNRRSTRREMPARFRRICQSLALAPTGTTAPTWSTA